MDNFQRPNFGFASGMNIDILKLLDALRRNILVVFLSAVICSGIVFGYTYFRIAPQYSATVSFYVNTSSTQSLASSLLSTSSAGVSTARLVDTYLYILKSRETLEEVCDESGLDISYGWLRNKISTTVVENVTGFKVTVQCSNPAMAEKLANTIAEVLPNRISDIVDGTTTKIVDHAIIPTARSSPDYMKNAMTGFAAGGILAAVIILALEYFRTSKYVVIESADDLRECFADYPVLAMIPDMRLTNKKGYYSHYAYYSEGKKVAK